MRNDNEDELIDVGAAMTCSSVGPLHGRPYPVQFRSQGAFEAWRGAVGGTPIWTRWVQPHATCGDITQEMLWQLEQEWPLAGLPKSIAAPVLATRQLFAVQIGANLKYQINKGTVIEATPALETLLAHSDVDLSVKMSMVGLPYASQYLRFGPAASGYLKLPGSTVRDRVFDGVFCFASPSVDGDGWTLEFVFICKRHDCFDGHVLLLGVNERDDTTVAAWLDRILAPEANASVEGYLRPMHAAVSYVVKLFLYMGLKQARVVEQRHHDIALRRLAGVGERKRAKLAQRAASLYNGIVVGPEALPTGPSARGAGMEVAPHWRRGHFRMQACGLRNLDRKLIFVAPVLIHADRLAGDAPAPRSYRASAGVGVAA